ncbi:MAG: L-glutamate gamma-semialdehyde dehydrogenase [Sphingomonadales bacterium]|nr:L-glutamate gamma-semialdehyde dehydrogenase [Sphingomonadales bacterium]
MSFGIFSVPPAVNEKVRSYAPGSPEALSLKQTIHHMRQREVEVPMMIGGQEVHSKQTRRMAPPHDHAHTLGHFHEGSASHVEKAIEAALAAKPAWEALPWEQRAAIFLRMADLLAGPYRDLINAATMLSQSKNPYQAEIDAACELIDFFRFNVRYMTEIYRQQPESLPGSWNRVEYRPLEGFVFALTPFNFTSIAANLPCSAALMGNTVVWKPANTQVYSAYWLMRLFKEAGLPDGVINMVPVPGPVAGEVIFRHPDFAGIHFTGSSGVFNQIWEQIGRNIGLYKSYPRIVGETGGKDFVVAHASAPVDVVATALSRGAFEYQGQKCSAASRAYIPDVLWPEVLQRMRADLSDMKMGGVEDFGNFINAVIDEKSFDKLQAAIEEARQHPDCEIVWGGNCDKSLGYFVEPTLIQTTNPKYRTMCEELFGPVLTVYVYPEDRFEEVLDLCNTTSPYALTGAVLATDRYALDLATTRLRHAAGNFYLNDKPTGAVVGQQPFGGARASGTNDKAGSSLNLLRWVSARTIKENLLPPTTYTYPFQG